MILIILLILPSLTYSDFREYPIGKAIQKGASDEIRSLLQANPNLINLRTYYGASPFLHAIESNQLESAKVLLKLGANIHDKDSSGSNALFIAARYADLDIFNWLVSKKFDPRSLDSNGNNILFPAVYSKDPGRIKHFVGLGVDPNQVSNSKKTPIFFAVYGTGDYGKSIDGLIAKTLIENGADYHLRDENKLTPLVNAIQTSTPEMVRVLLTFNHSKEELSEAFFNTPYSYSFFTEHVQLLIDRGVDINAIDPVSGQNLLIRYLFDYKWLYKKINLEHLRFMVKKGIDIQPSSTLGKRALALAKREKIDLTLLAK